MFLTQCLEMTFEGNPCNCAGRSDMADAEENLGLTERIVAIIVVVDIGVLARGAAAMRQLGVFPPCLAVSC